MERWRLERSPLVPGAEVVQGLAVEVRQRDELEYVDATLASLWPLGRLRCSSIPSALRYPCNRRLAAKTSCSTSWDLSSRSEACKQADLWFV